MQPHQLFTLGSSKPSQSSSSNSTQSNALGDPSKQIETDRLGKTLSFGGNNIRDAKRERDEYAVNLRKQKRDELHKRRRGFQSSQESANAAPNTNPKEEGPLKGLSIEQALDYQKGSGVDVETFISEVSKNMRFNIEEFPILVNMIKQEEFIIKLLGCVGMRKLLSIEGCPPIQATIDEGLIPTFIEMLYHNVPKFQFESAWCLTNIASGSTEHVQKLIERDVVTHFLNLLESPHSEIVEQVIWGLGNIAGDCPAMRNLILETTALQKIADLIDNDTSSTSFIRNASWTLSNLCRGKPQPPYQMVRRAIPSLAKIVVEYDREDIIMDVCWALSYLSDGSQEKIQDLHNMELLRKMVQLLYHDNIGVQTACLRTMGNMVTGDDIQTQTVVDMGLIRALHFMFNLDRATSVKRDICWVISNITAGTEQQLQLCIEQGIIDQVVETILTGNPGIRSEAIWAISNCTASAVGPQFSQLIEKGIIKALGTVLRVDFDAKMLMVALQGIENLLKEGQKYEEDTGENIFSIEMEREGCLDNLENLQSHPNHNVYQQALHIIDTYFTAEESEDPFLTAMEQQTTNTTTGGMSENQTAEMSTTNTTGFGQSLFNLD